MYNSYLYKLYFLVHKTAKILLHRKSIKRKFRMVSVEQKNLSKQSLIIVNGTYFNDIKLLGDTKLRKSDVFPIENIVENGSNKHLKDSYIKKKKKLLYFGISNNDSAKVWESFINASVIPTGYKNAGLHYAGYISGKIHQWCLPSWIWTNAALVRLYCRKGEIDRAIQLAKLLEVQQQESGGWIVRNDYGPNGVIPTLAPNDSAYISNNAFLEIYKATHEVHYLEVAIKCADWIIKSARNDGMVWSGFDMKQKSWIKKHNIVDTGFTAALFANLYAITNNKKYKLFLEKFVNRYIQLFYNHSKKGFSTGLNEKDEQVGGMFGRGQAWALEGLIPAYSVLRTEFIKNVIEDTVNNLLKVQLKNGGWYYNLTRPLMGEDGKAVSVIAKNLLEWNIIEPNEKIITSVKNAIDWCKKHTAINYVCKGGIFSYNLEGAIVHHLYTETAFVYSSAYAIELFEMLNLYEKNNLNKRL